jgi:hypothetical protein
MKNALETAVKAGAESASHSPKALPLPPIDHLPATRVPMAVPKPLPTLLPTVKEPKSALGAFIDKSIGLGDRFNTNQKLGILTDQSSHVVQGKLALMKFCNYFKDVPFDMLENDPYFIMYFRQICHNDSSIHTRAFQLAIETVFKRKLFLESDIRGAFSPSFGLIDVVGTNKGLVDTSTFYSCLQTDHLIKQPDFQANIEIRIVVSTCLKSDKDSLKTLSPITQQFMNNSHSATGNALNDIMLSYHHYDYKNIKNIEVNKNHLIFLDFDTINNTATGRRYLYNLLNNFSTIVKITPDIRSTHYVQQAKNKLELIINEPSLAIFDKISLWNSYVYSTINKRPPEVFLPLLIPTTTANYTPDPNMKVNDVKLPLSKSLEAPDALNAVKNITKTFNPKTQYKAWLATKGIIGEEQSQINNETVD